MQNHQENQCGQRPRKSRLQKQNPKVATLAKLPLLMVTLVSLLLVSLLIGKELSTAHKVNGWQKQGHLSLGLTKLSRKKVFNLPDAKVQSALKQIEGLEGQYIGSGQCYALSAKYSQIMGGPGLGGGVTGLSDVIGDAMAAANIGSGFNWKKYGWSVINNPSVDQLKNASGAIINFKANQGAPLYTGWAGHTGVLLAVNGDQLVTMEQNGYPIRACHKYTRNIGQTQPTVSSICLPPGAGGTGSSSGNAGSSGTSDVEIDIIHVGTLAYDNMYQNTGILSLVINTLTNYTDEVFGRENPNYKNVKERNEFFKKQGEEVKKHKNNVDIMFNPRKRNFTELQMLSQDITQFKIYNAFGDSFEFYPLRFNTSSKNWEINYGLIGYYGGLGYNTELTISPVAYDYYNVVEQTANNDPRDKEGKDDIMTYLANNAIARHKSSWSNTTFYSNLKDSDKVWKDRGYLFKDGLSARSLLAVNRPERFTFGLKDRASRTMPILADSTASYMQSNRSQIEAKRTNFNEQNSLIALQSKQRLAHANLANQQAMFGANYSLQTQQYKNSVVDRDYNFNQGTNLIGAGSQMLSGNILGGVVSGATGWLGNDYKRDDAKALGGLAESYAAGMKGYTAQGNQLRSTDAQVANMAAKMNINQAIRNFNASLADLGDQPDTLQQMGDDIITTTRHFWDGYHIDIRLPEPSAFKQIYTYIRDYGSKVNTYVEDIQNVFKNRKRFNYIKVTDIDLSSMEISQHYKDSLKNVFISGTRFWNENVVHENNYNPFDTSIDNVDYEGEGTLGNYSLWSAQQLKELKDEELSDIGLFRKYHQTLLHFSEQTTIKVNNAAGELDDRGEIKQVDVFIGQDTYWLVNSQTQTVTLQSIAQKEAFEKTFKGKFRIIEVKGDYINVVNEEDFYKYHWSYGDSATSDELNKLYPLDSQGGITAQYRAKGQAIISNQTGNDIVYYQAGQQGNTLINNRYYLIKKDNTIEDVTGRQQDFRGLPSLIGTNLNITYFDNFLDSIGFINYQTI